MTYSRQAQLLGMGNTQRSDIPGAPTPPFHIHQPEGIVSLQPGPRMPMRKVNYRPVSAFPQAQPSETLELVQRPEMHRQQSAPAREPLSKNEEILAFLDEWMKEPDELGEEWWARFDEELKAQRLNIPERELP
ncbi:MAG TPA: hypothetical protein VNM90_01890 [Haliangium sp.]|nr:hypothetical protein [Haliangium sp.]